MDLFGYQFKRDDPTLYLIAWVIVTLALVVMASKWGATAVGFAITALFGVILYTQRNQLPSTLGGSGQSGFGPKAGAGQGVGGGGGGSW